MNAQKALWAIPEVQQIWFDDVEPAIHRRYGGKLDDTVLVEFRDAWLLGVGIGVCLTSDGEAWTVLYNQTAREIVFGKFDGKKEQ
jgi:hypothetical protein